MKRDLKKYLLIAVAVIAVLMIGALSQKGNANSSSETVSEDVEIAAKDVETKMEESETKVSEQPLIDYADKIESYVSRSGSGNVLGEMGYLEITHDEFLNIDGDELYKFMTETYPALSDKYNYIIIRSNMDEGMLINNSEIVTVGIACHGDTPKVEADEQFYNSVKDVGNVSRNWVHKGDTFVYVEEKKSN